MNLPYRTRGLLIALSVVVGPLPALCQTEREALQALTVDALKRLYLSCDREATRHRLSTSTIQHCSAIYEELKWRAFDGDFERLLAWSRAQPPTLADR